MVKLDFDKMNQLSNSDLVIRMDSILKQSRIERNPHYDPRFDLTPYVQPFFNTKSINELTELNQRKAIWTSFDFILQMEYVSRCMGFQNQMMDVQKYDQNGWSSPNKYISYLAQEQASIIGSRIALERIIGLVYFIVEKKEITQTSKFGFFQDWLMRMPIESDWFYLIPFLPWMREHDIEFRTAEVHSGSKLKKYLVALQDIPQDIQNDALNLTNILQNLWQHLLILFNGERPNGAGGIKPNNNISWLTYYVSKNFVELDKIKLNLATTV